MTRWAYALIVCCLVPIGWADDDSTSALREGWEHFRLGEYDPAVKLFTRAETVATSPESKAQALYGLATTWNLRRPGEDAERAERIYRQAITTAPQSDVAAWSLFAVARMKETAAAYQEVIERFPARPAGEEAFLFQQALALAAPDAATAKPALTALQSFLRAHPQSPYQSAAYKLIAQCYQILNEPKEQLAATVQALQTEEVDPLNPIDRAVTYWRIGTLAEFRVGDFSLAREYYRKLIAEYPTDQRVFVAKQELRRMDEMEAKLRP